MSRSLLGGWPDSSRMLQIPTKWNWNTLTLLSGRGSTCVPGPDDQRQPPSDHASRSVTSAVSLGASSVKGLSSLLGGGGWGVTTARRRPLLGSLWNEPRLAFISCLLATRALRTEMQRWTVVFFRPNLWHLTCDENLQWSLVTSDGDSRWF